MKWEDFKWDVKTVRCANRGKKAHGLFRSPTTRVEMGDAVRFRQLTVTVGGDDRFEVDNGVPGCVGIELKANQRPRPLRARTASTTAG